MATVIKASSAPTTVFQPEELGNEGAKYLEHVRAQAAEILRAAELEAAQIRQHAEEAGRAAGLADAELQVTRRVDQQLATLTPLVDEAIVAIHTARGQWLAHWESAAVRLAVAIASRVVRREVAQSPPITLGLVREALELAAGSSHVQLRLHPDDLNALGTHVTRLVDELARLGSCEIVADEHIERGGCRLDTRFGTIDQQFGAQLARIEQELA